MNVLNERFEMRLDQETLNNLEEWRSNQDDIPSRAEAVRRLMDVGLRMTSKTKLRLSHGELLITQMLCDLYKHLKIKGDIEPEFVEAAILGGHYWGLEWQYPGIFHNYEDNENNVSEVVDIIDMWFFIESGFNKLSKKDKTRVEKEAHPFGKNVSFPGFDGNNESEYMGIANFLINKLERFPFFKNKDFNSHFPSIDGYRRMFRVFEPMRVNLMGVELNASQIIELLKARIHPDNKKS